MNCAIMQMCPVPAQRWQGWPVPAQIWQGCPSSDAHGGLGPTRGGGREPRSVANVARMSEVEAQMYRVRVQSRSCAVPLKCDSGQPTPIADVAKGSPFPAQMWPGKAEFKHR